MPLVSSKIYWRAPGEGAVRIACIDCLKTFRTPTGLDWHREHIHKPETHENGGQQLDIAFSHYETVASQSAEECVADAVDESPGPNLATPNKFDQEVARLARLAQGAGPSNVETSRRLVFPCVSCGRQSESPVEAMVHFLEEHFRFFGLETRN